MPFTLYYHPLSSYCHKVLVALYENNIAFEARTIDLGAQPDRAELGALWPLCKFPVLRDMERERNVPESSIIIEYLDRFAGVQHALIPSDFNDALQVRLWDRIFDNHVHGHVQDIVLDKILGSKGDMAGARASIQTAYGLIDQQLACPCPGPRAKASAWPTAPLHPPCFMPTRWRLSPSNTCTCAPISKNSWPGHRCSGCWQRPNPTSTCTRFTAPFPRGFCNTFTVKAQRQG